MLIMNIQIHMSNRRRNRRSLINSREFCVFA